MFASFAECGAGPSGAPDIAVYGESGERPTRHHPAKKIPLLLCRLGGRSGRRLLPDGLPITGRVSVRRAPARPRAPRDVSGGQVRTFQQFPAHTCNRACSNANPNPGEKRPPPPLHPRGDQPPSPAPPSRLLKTGLFLNGQHSRSAPAAFRLTAHACPDKHLAAADALGADIRGAIVWA